MPKRISTAIAALVGGAALLALSLWWASARFDVLDSGASGSSVDALVVGAIIAALVVLAGGLFLLIRGLAGIRSRRSHDG